MKIRKVQLASEIRIPGPPGGIATSTGSFFTSPDYDIDYDPASALVCISRGGERRLVHASRIVEMDPGPAEKAPAAKAPGKPLPKES